MSPLVSSVTTLMIGDLIIERKNLNFRTWIKRLARKTICFSKLEKMHDIVIGLLINKVEFGVDIYA